MSNALRQALESWYRAGVMELPPAAGTLSFPQAEPLSETAVESPTKSIERQSEPMRSARGEISGRAAGDRQLPSETPRSTRATETEPLSEPTGTGLEANPIASDMAAASKLELLRQRVSACTRCSELAASRTQTVFGVGNANAEIMFVGEAPGADEDRVGEPFVGKAGQLLDRIIAASGWRREDLYICNILRCRPPGNRNPTNDEAANCREYLDGQIEAVKPRWIVCWGSVAAKNLLGVDRPIGRMRKQLFDSHGAKVLCTYHPSYLLRNPSAKKEVWADLQFLYREMGHTPPKIRK